MTSKLIYVTVLSLIFSFSAFAKVIHYSELSEAEMHAFMEGKSEDVCEVRKNDVFKVKLDLSGNVLEATNNNLVKVKVKKGFFLKMSEQQLLMSWDGEEFKPFKDLLSGQLSVAASGDRSVDSVSIKLEANAKE